MTPIRNQVLVKPFPGDEMSEGGIIVPENVRKPSNRVLVIKTGNGTKDKPMRMRGGIVAYRVKDWGCPVEIGGELHFLMDEGALLATE
jgi:co-chaperonin GroES (HSP10)